MPKHPLPTGSRRTAIVAGAGLGGLTSAIALEQAGYDVTIVERARELAPVGAGISLWPNAIMALKSLGVGAGLLRIAAPAQGTTLHRADGRPRARSLSDTLPARFGAPLLVVHRAELQALLLSALSRPAIRTGWALDTVRAEGRGRMVVRSASGATLSADLVVAA